VSESSSERRLGAVKRGDGDPGTASTPLGDAGDASARGGGATPAANQGKNEPFGETPETSAQSRTASTTSDDPQAPAHGGAGGESRAATEPGRSPADSGGAGSDDPDDIARAGRASRVPGEQGEPPHAVATDDVAGAVEAHPGSPPTRLDAGVPSPGDSQGVAVPGVHAAAGTSEESGAVDGIKTTALAPPGKPDGEVDTRA
jgi:hypothetical protein